MPDALQQALALPGLNWLILTIGAAGLVRGFTGFGTAMIFVPVATQFLPIADVVFLMAATGIVSTCALAPQAWRECDKSEISTLGIAAAITVPLGLWIMAQVDTIILRWIACGIIGLTLFAVITGWRWEGRLGLPGRLAVGASAGVVGGMTGLTGPVVIVFYLASSTNVRKIRANTIIFLALLDIAIVFNILIRGAADMSILWIVLLLGVPYLITTLIGKAVFDPKLERIYRVAAYSVILIAVVSGLPILD
ncbi:sulfite exporter TauE/SafE family protein [Ruegeria sp. HKCCD9179]|uniref:sulfite exporter TauE/SafE family protein n=1 Tax=Ruegeria sp. HKCCD9179 TaxID=2683016 RepID=UPI0014893C22|nr:sulfite exporter TauE/SafE family protein [Ruegeria sp. HKCCD9179]